ncbi:MAG: archease, partial [Candidatus Humimicrobiaceae bacterium]
MDKKKNKKIFKKYESVDHLSDVEIRAYGRTITELFENAAEGMFSLIADLTKVKKEVEKEILINIKKKIEAEDLMVIWLEKLLYFFEVEGIVFSHFKILDFRNSSSQSGISALIAGEKINLKKHEL